jgi:hypothetical protein
MPRPIAVPAREEAAEDPEFRNRLHMSMDISLDSVFSPSEDVVARMIEGELILVPIAAGVGDIEDALFTLNETGRAIWQRLNGIRTLREIAADLAAEYDSAPGTIEDDILGLVAELLSRRMILSH